MSPENLSRDVLDTLNFVKDYGLKLAIGSSSKNAPLILAQIGLGEYFDAVSDGNNITHSKPNPEVFIMAAEYIKENPSNCLVIEDAKAGIDAAHSAGMDSAGIGEAAEHPLATYRLSKFSDIKKIIIKA
jgi:HAD superfamily hydrolase (TIGR01509 family)